MLSNQLENSNVMGELEGGPVRPVLFDVVGIIPATEKTPDIFYSHGAGSEKVAGLTFLSLWFLHPDLQTLVKERASAVICSETPLTGGLKLEKQFEKALKGVPELGKRMDKIGVQYYVLNKDYGGRCYQPELDVEGRVERQGFLVVYGRSKYADGLLAGEVTLAEYEKDSVLHPDGYYQLIDDLPHTGCVQRLVDIFASESSDREAALAQILYEEFSDASGEFDNVPMIVAHELGHLLGASTGLQPTQDIVDEVALKITRKAKEYQYYKDPQEAVAELAGIVFLRMIQCNAGIDFGLPNSMLDEVLPKSYDLIEKEVGLLCKAPTP